ncbi:CRISPR-associated protein Cas4 [uncultured Mediterranean phage]|nr:CRISPR-associated protein Cas4 [uncultured Mediterranean phage]
MPKLSQVLQNREKHWIEAAFDDYDKTQQREPYVRTHFSPSQAHLCPRALYYHMLGYNQDPIASQSLRRMGMGTVFHEFIENKLTETGLLVSSEVEVTYDDPPIRGFYDAVAKRPEDGKDILLEVKSMAEPKNPKYAQYLPRHDHLIQWNLYSLMTGINEGIIFYINKNNQEYIICETERNESIIENTLEKFRTVQDYIKRGEMYPYVPEWKHDWCNFRATCERDHFINQK